LCHKTGKACTSWVYGTLDVSRTTTDVGSNRQIQETALKRFRDFLSDNSGATAIEYGLIAAGISLAIIAVVNGLGTNINTMFTSINNSLK
jgi:pilus assembly protein Flp/PilA